MSTDYKKELFTKFTIAYLKIIQHHGKMNDLITLIFFVSIVFTFSTHAEANAKNVPVVYGGYENTDTCSTSAKIKRTTAKYLVPSQKTSLYGAV